jgi:hypothetical protein
MVDMLGWSHEAIMRHKSVGGLSQAQRDYALKSMQLGPRLDSDGHTLIVPSEKGWYKAEASQFWKAQGFRWDGFKWTRDARRLWNGKRYSPEAWLRSLTRKYREFYPELYHSDSEHKQN